jgi:glyoxylase-like metal-dependent hydrolase (beta-lactamase superfamily II)
MRDKHILDGTHIPRTMNVPEITPQALVRAIEGGQDIQVLDIRAPQQLATGHIDILPEERFFNIASSQLAVMGDLDATGMSPTRPVAVVCARGISSQPATLFLLDRGFDARSVRGGMMAWMSAVVPRELPAPQGFDTLMQFDRIGKGALGYLLIAEEQALVIDPGRDLEPYLDTVQAIGARITGVADTHVHADYISGAPDLAKRLDIPYYLHPADNCYPYDGTPGRLEISPLRDGATIPLGPAEVRAWHNPGHTEGSTSLLANGYAFTGDFIFVNSIGRPDLGGKVEEWAIQLWASVVRARENWPGNTEISPAHYASQTERRADHSVGRTLQEIVSSNEPMGFTNEQEFVAWVLERQSAFPDQYRTIKAVNVGLASVTPEQADVLDMGKNECAVG